MKSIAHRLFLFLISFVFFYIYLQWLPFWLHKCCLSRFTRHYVYLYKFSLCMTIEIFCTESNYLINHLLLVIVIGIDTNIKIIVDSSTAWEAHYSPRRSRGLLYRIWSWSPIPREIHGAIEGQKSRPKPEVIVVTAVRGTCLQHGMGDHNEIPLHHAHWLIYFLFLLTEISSLVSYNGLFVARFMCAWEIALWLWTNCQGTEMNNCYDNLNTCFTWVNGV